MRPVRKIEQAVPAESEPIALPIAKFARTFGIGQATVYRHLQKGLLKYKVVGSRRYVLIPLTQEGPRVPKKNGPRAENSRAQFVRFAMIRCHIRGPGRKPDLNNIRLRRVCPRQSLGMLRGFVEGPMNRRGTDCEPRELDLYNGRDRLGTITVRGRKYQPLGRDGAVLGEFPDQRSAARAVMRAARGILAICRGAE